MNTHNVDDLSSPKNRAIRLKRVRNLANLLQSSMCDDPAIPINIHSYKGWERARYGGLTDDAAVRICRRVAKEGVIVTPEWLLHQIGAEPTLSPVTDIETDVVYPDLDPSNDNLIIEELKLFKSHFKNSMECIVPDDTMLPFYEKGDYVAGIVMKASSYDDAIGKNCIALLKNGQVLVRKLIKSQSEHSYHLLCTHLETTVGELIIKNANIIKLAKILWHRKLS